MDVPVVIAASLEDVWTVLIDTTRWPLWGPSVKEVECTQRYIEAGSEGRVKTPVGIWLGFKVTEFKPLQCWSWDVVGVPATGHRVEAIPEGGTRLVFEVPLLAMPYAGICYMAGKRIAAIVSSR